MQFVNPLDVLGFLALPLLVSNLLLVFGFALSAYFAWKYTQTFYGDRPKPKSWKFLILALLLMSFSEIGATLLFYTIGPKIFLVIFTLVLIIARIFAGIFIILGSWLLYKEVSYA